MTRHALPWALALTLLPGLALAQELTGSYELEGRYSNRRATAVEVTISKTSAGEWSVRRTGRYTSSRHESKPAFTWTSRSVKVSGRILHAEFMLEEPGYRTVDGILGGLDPDRSTSDDVLRAILPRSNTFKGIYLLSRDGQRLTEYVVNQTRLGEQRWWRWVNTSGERRAAASASPLTPAQFEASALASMEDWYRAWIEQTYADELADAVDDPIRVAELRARKASDLVFANNVTVHTGDPHFDYHRLWIEDRYRDGNPPLDPSGQMIPKEALRLKTLEVVPQIVGLSKMKVFLFDSRTGDLVGTSRLLE